MSPELSTTQKIFVLLSEIRHCINDDRLMEAQRKVFAIEALVKELAPPASAGGAQDADVELLEDSIGYFFALGMGDIADGLRNILTRIKLATPPSPAESTAAERRIESLCVAHEEQFVRAEKLQADATTLRAQMIEPLHTSDDPEESEALRVNKPQGYVLYAFNAWETETRMHRSKVDALKRQIDTLRAQIEQLLVFGEQDKEAARLDQIRSQYEFYGGWVSALQRVLALMPTEDK